jgi:hypothetical protein
LETPDKDTAELADLGSVGFLGLGIMGSRGGLARLRL